MRTRFTNTHNQLDRPNLIWQLENLESAMAKHDRASHEYAYLAAERYIILQLLEITS